MDTFLLGPAQLQHRRSLYERRNSSRPSLMTQQSKRRLERHSITAPAKSLELSLLEHIQVQFVKAFVPANKLAQPRYVMKVTNLALNQSWEMVRHFKEFYDMKESLLRALNHGHLCRSNCPWLFMFITHHFPRRHLFRSRHASVVSARLTELEAFITTLLRVMKEDRSLECQVSSEAIPKILYDFLFEGMVFDRSDLANTVLEDRVSLTGAPPCLEDLRSSLSMESESCTICERALRPCESFGSFSRASDLTATTASTDSSSSSDESVVSLTSQSSALTDLTVAALTTLECGHRFHDECILEKLNQHLECPLCLVEAAAA
ncbi:hypothetical protein Poli38472_009101 [Pythium oligandrum]|uniref:RING-type domain-containing protein n=1 Tax=Pythium oligandrum TaxID=41045 RepID=A0A8K1FL66_PYTOL|nr:hypothetical protein Poli38472_009101 [Pythium oligandrum]|eukprot:TMW64934.1 hypothetical protein Poli38472_009101 [Pythium oligandrum]